MLPRSYRILVYGQRQADVENLLPSLEVVSGLTPAPSENNILFASTELNAIKRKANGNLRLQDWTVCWSVRLRRQNLSSRKSSFRSRSGTTNS
jgi:hypothetical protein